jgi:hypothetical protein
MRHTCNDPAGVATNDCAQNMALFADAVFGAPQLAVEIFGDASKWRRIYKLRAKGWPVFRLGWLHVGRLSANISI